MKRLYILTLCSVLAALGISALRQKPATTIAAGKGVIVPRQWLHSIKQPITPTVQIRPADQTFLTFPEWYLVFSPDEQATYFTTHTATSFPFMSHTAQIWESYKIVCDQIREDFPVNKGYHFMIWVIGSSATVEYAIKAWYETLIGRITDTGIPITAEDRFNAVFTRNYVDLIRDRPWYKYNFKKQLTALWTEVPLTGSHFLRKVDRRYILTSELLVKWAYGKLIGLGTKQIYDEALSTTAVVLEDNKVSVLPRYDRFMTEAQKLAKQGHTFREVAGNTSAILVTTIVQSSYSPNFKNAVKLFEQPIASNRAIKRVAIVTPVSGLSPLLTQLQQDHVKVEHIFDY